MRIGVSFIRAILPRHRLFPQPGGFERLIGIEVVPHPNHLAVLELDEVAKGRLDLGGALLATGVEAADGDDSMARLVCAPDPGRCEWHRRPSVGQGSAG